MPACAAEETTFPLGRFRRRQEHCTQKQEHHLLHPENIDRQVMTAVLPLDRFRRRQEDCTQQQ